MKNSRKNYTLIFLLLLFGLHQNATAQWSVTALDVPFVIDLDNSVSGVNNGAFADFTLNPGQYFYLRWDGDDVSGTGSRDAFALDDIEVELMLNPCVSLVMAQGDVIQPQCFGGDDGFISAVVTGGTAPYNFSWEESTSIDSLRTGLEAGSYKIYIEDAIGCIDSLSFILGQPSQVTLSLDNLVNETCPGAANGYIDVTATGGTGSKTFNWSNNVTSSMNENLTSGLYTVTATDDNGCTAEETYEVQVTNLSPVVTCPSSVITSICLGFEIDLDTLGFSPAGGMFSINGNVNGSIFGPTSQNLGSNDIWYIYTDQITGCTDSCLYVINVEENPLVAVCQNQTVDLDNMGSATLAASALNGGSTGCGSLIFTVDGQSTLNFTCSDIGIQAVTLTVTDDTGNTSTCMAGVNIRDVTPPVFECQDITVSLDANGMFTISSANYVVNNIQTNYEDNCASSSPSFAIPVNVWNCSNIGPNSTTIFALDGNGNETPCTFTLTITDDLDVCCPTYTDGIAYVNVNAIGANDGTSWDDAFSDLQDALNSACPGITEIWVTQGTYYPDQGGGQTNTDRNATFQLKNGVSIYGGFAGTETLLSQRNWATNVTTLSGDIGTVGNSTDNSYNVVTGSGTNATAAMDGFTITGGNANDTFPNTRGGGMYNNNGSPTVTNCTFSGNEAIEGGGMYNFGSSPTIANVTFSSNSATQTYGGGMNNSSGSNPNLTYVSFTNNSAFLGGGGIANITSSPTVTNCTFLGNSAPGGLRGGGIYNDFSSPTVTNSIFSNNAQEGMHNESGSSPLVTNSIFWGSGFNGIYNSSSSPTVTNCIIWGNTSGGIFNESSSTPIVNYTIVQGGYTGTNNLNTDPLFVNAAGGDFRLIVLSPAINAGNPSTNLSFFLNGPDNPEDLDGNPRVIDDIIDMGAYESQVICPTGNVLYVNASAMGDNNGTSWDDAFTDLQDALNSACPEITQIWVATGTYYPDQGGGQSNDDRNATFHLKNGVAIYGGFPNTGDPSMAERDWVANVTILSGDINQSGDLTDNSYSVVTGSGTDATAEMDGFTITGGNANGTFPNTRGGGMYNSSGSPTVTNCTFSGNSVDSRGGGMYNVLFSSPTVTNCTFSGNTASSTGGGMHNISGSSPTVTNCTFSGNSSTDNGGGMLNSSSSPMVTNCTFSGNTASNIGGGMLNFLESSPTVTNCTFSGNSAFDGGGIHNFEYSSPTVTNCTFSGNTAGSNGGGMINFTSSSPTVTNCTFSGNSATSNGGGMFNITSSSPTVTNCIIWGNSSGGIINASSSTPIVNYSIVQGGFTGTGNLDIDPLFVDAGNGNLRLLACSPAIDAGTANGTPNNDLDGNTRPVNAAPNRPGDYDMGAYEFQGTVPGPTLVCADNLTVQLDADLTATVTATQIGNTSTGCTPMSFLIDGESSLTFDCDQVGSQTVTLQVTDLFMNVETTTCSFTVADDDSFCNQPPVAVCQPVTVNADINCEAAVTAEAFDGGSTDPDMDMLTFTVSPEGPYPLGTTNVTLTVSDGMAMSQCMTTVSVEDNTPPVVTCQEFSANFSACSDAIFPNTPSGAFFPIGDLSDFSVAAGGAYMASFDITTCVTDNCSGEGFQSALVDSYEENRVAGCSVDIINVVAIRDAAGNQAADSIFFRFTFTFDGDPPVITCPDGANIECGVIPTAVATDASATSGCGTPAIIVSDAVINGDPDMAGTTYTFTFTATDDCGKTSTCDQVFTVVDNTPPTIACFNQTLNFNGEMSIPLDENDLVEATDNCGVQSISLSPNSISSSQVGQTVPVAVTVTDVNGNSATCTSQITVDGLPAGWSQNANGVGCTDGNDIDYNASNAVWTATSTNCYYTPPYTSDATAFAQYSLCGNGSITAQVTGISGTSLGWAGVTMRETNAPGAKKAQLTTNMSNFSRREFRTATNGTAFPQQFPSQNRRWLRIVRSGNQFVMYVSPNGVNWAFAGVQNIQMNSCIEIGLVVTNYSSNSTVAATFANVSVTGGNQSLSDGGPASLAYQHDQPDFRDVKVYPNPTSGELNIALSGYESRSVTLEVFNTMGQMLFLKEIDEVQNTNESIDLSSVASGMYLIRVSSDGLPAEMKRVTVAR